MPIAHALQTPLCPSTTNFVEIGQAGGSPDDAVILPCWGRLVSHSVARSQLALTELIPAASIVEALIYSLEKGLIPVE